MIDPDDVKVLVKALQDNSQQLGIVWGVRIGTVTGTSPLRILFDGDEDQTGPGVDNDVTNVTGHALTVGMRVFVHIVPPAGIYVIGFMNVEF